VLRPHGLRATSALLLLDLEADRLELGPGDDGAALEQAVVDVRGALECEVAGAENRGAVEAEDVAGHDAGHAEGQADLVAGLDEVGAAVDVDGDVVGWLGGEEGEEVLDGGGDRARG